MVVGVIANWLDVHLLSFLLIYPAGGEIQDNESGLDP